MTSLHHAKQQRLYPTTLREPFLGFSPYTSSRNDISCNFFRYTCFFKTFLYHRLLYTKPDTYSASHHIIKHSWKRLFCWRSLNSILYRKNSVSYKVLYSKLYYVPSSEPHTNSFFWMPDKSVHVSTIGTDTEQRCSSSLHL